MFCSSENSEEVTCVICNLRLSADMREEHTKSHHHVVSSYFKDSQPKGKTPSYLKIDFDSVLKTCLVGRNLYEMTATTKQVTTKSKPIQIEEEHYNFEHDQVLDDYYESTQPQLDFKSLPQYLDSKLNQNPGQRQPTVE